jgi:AcrR family transcriptional regulator
MSAINPLDAAAALGPEASVFEDLWRDVQPETSRRLLVSALICFAARGFHATTTREIARLAGMSPAAVYVHYRSKNELLERIGITGHELVLRDMREAVEAATGAADGVRRFMESFAAWHVRHALLARVVNYELHNLPPDAIAVVRPLRAAMEALLRDLIDRGVADDEMAVEDSEAAVLALISLGIDVARWFGARRTAPSDLGPRYGSIALRIVGAPPRPTGE